MGRSDSGSSDRSVSSRSSSERDDRKKKKKDSRSSRRSRSRSTKKKGASTERDRKNRGRKDSSSRERKKTKKRDPSPADRKSQRRSSRSKDRKKRSASKDKRKKREKSISKKKRDKSESPKRKRTDRSSSQSKKNKEKSKGRSPGKGSAAQSQYGNGAAPQPELTEKERELKKQRERLAKMRLLKFAASEDSSDEENAASKKPTLPQPVVAGAVPAAAVVPSAVSGLVSAPPIISALNPTALTANSAVPTTSSQVPVAAAPLPFNVVIPQVVSSSPTTAIQPPGMAIQGPVVTIPSLIQVSLPAQQHQAFSMSDITIRSNGMGQQLLPQSQVKLEHMELEARGGAGVMDNQEKPIEDGQTMILRRGFEYIEDLIRQKQQEESAIETEESNRINEADDDGSRAKKILYDSDGLEEFSDEEISDQAEKGTEKHKQVDLSAVDIEKKKKLQAMLSKEKTDDTDDFSNVFASTKSTNDSTSKPASQAFTFAAPKPVNAGGASTAFSFSMGGHQQMQLNGGNTQGNLGLVMNAGNKNVIGGSNGTSSTSSSSNINFGSSAQNKSSTNAGFNPMKTQLPQQLTPEEDSDEDELDAYCRMLDEQLENETPLSKRNLKTSAKGGQKSGKTNGGDDNEDEDNEEPVNYITMEEIFGKKEEEEETPVKAEDEELSEDENDEFDMMKRRERMELEGTTVIDKEEAEAAAAAAAAAAALEEEEEDDEHYRAFKEAMRLKKTELLKDHTGDLLMDDEQEIEEKSVQLETDTGENKEDYLERLKREAQKKDLKPVEYKSADLEKFRKNFYIESKEITNLTEEEIVQVRENLGEISVRGLNVPRPIRSWYQSGLSDRVLDVLIRKKKYDKPFPIQCQSLPVIMSGRDTIGIAETGSGKTLAYILPMIRHIADQRPIEEGDGPIGLIIVPTRELAIQIYMEALPFLKPYSFEIVAVFGGTGIQGQLSELKRGCEIVVCTPGRLFDVLTTSNGKITNLKRSTMVVIDEADRMFDLGFEPQIAKILATTRPDKQTVLFSATFPKNVELLARKLMRHKPVEIMVGARGQACTNITQIIEIREETTRIYRLLELLGKFCEQGQVIIFVDKQMEVDSLYTQLRMQHYNPTILHAGVDADDRTNNLLDFKKGIYRILIATSVSSRGIDVKNVVLVVNYRCPNHIEDYIHRIGRTGRAGNKGTAVTFLGKDEDKYSLDLIKVLKRSDQKVPLELLVMGEEFKQKLKSGEAKQYGNQNMQGKGFSFDEDELDMANKAKFEQKKFVAMKMGIEVEDKLDEEEIFKKKSLDDDKSAKDKKSNKPELTFQQKLHIVLTQDEYKELREQMLSESSKVAVMRKNQGQGDEAIKKATEEIFRKGLENFKPTTKNVDIGKVEIAKMLQEFEKTNEDENNQNVAELVINDYPENVRKSITRKDFLERIYIQTGCTVLQRGVLVEVGKKVVPGFQKLYLRIEGDSRFKVMMAYKDLKTEAEERSIRMHERGQNQGGRFILP